MVWEHLHEKVAARLSRRRYLGLHLTLGLLFSLALVFAFSVLGHHANGQGALSRFDTAFGLWLADHRRGEMLLRVLLMTLTLLGSFEFMVVFVPLVGVLLWRRRRRLLAVIWLVAGVGAGVLNQALKNFYDRPRPVFKDPWVYESNQSFPSGHSLGSLVIFGLLAYLLALLLPNWRGRVVAVAGTALLVFLIGFSRIYLGAHYFSDVLGGFCVGAAWLAACITAVESVRLHPRHHQPRC